MTRRAASCKRTVNQEIELDMEEKEATPVEEVEKILPPAEPNKTTESVDMNSIMKFLQETSKQNSETLKQMEKKRKEDSETLKQMDSNNETSKQMKEDSEKLNKKIDNNNETMKHHLEEYREEICLLYTSYNK